jgi:hypothetical protein
MIIPFTIEALKLNKRKARDLNPHPKSGNRVSSAARPTISGYLPFFTSVDSPRIELGFSDCQPDVFPLDHEPVLFSGPAGDQPSVGAREPRFPVCKAGVVPLDQQPVD